MVRGRVGTRGLPEIEDEDRVERLVRLDREYALLFGHAIGDTVRSHPPNAESSLLCEKIVVPTRRKRVQSAARRGPTGQTSAKLRKKSSAIDLGDDNRKVKEGALRAYKSCFEGTRDFNMSKRSAPDGEKPVKNGKSKGEAEDDSGSDEVCANERPGALLSLTTPGLRHARRGLRVLRPATRVRLPRHQNSPTATL